MSTASVRWLEADRSSASGVSFGMPWPKGYLRPGQAFTIGGDDQTYPLDCREIAYWPDGSLKWTAHSVSGNLGHHGVYRVKPVDTSAEQTGGISIKEESGIISVSTRAGLGIEFSLSAGSSLFNGLTLSGRSLCSGATLVASINKKEYATSVKNIVIENATDNRAVIKVSGNVVADGKEHLPFDVRVYVYSDAPTIRIVHSFIHDLDGDEPLTSLGVQFKIPLQDTEFYNRHVRLGGAAGGVLKEEVQGLSGLRFGPTTQNRIDQTSGKPVVLREDEWEKTNLSVGLASVATWDAYSLSQLSSDGFTIKKRTKPGCSWVRSTGGGRSDGTVYVGSANHGGIAVGLNEFWERHPTQIDLSNLTKDEGAITMWLYSPLAEPLETMPYHDGLGLDTYPKQLDALNVTYEDYEPGFATANGIARSNQLFLRPFLATPSNEDFSLFSSLVRDPPCLSPTPEYMHSTKVFHGCWSPGSRILGDAPSEKESNIEKNLDLLFGYYKGQVEQHRWYGFLDYGDVQHTYDPYRHAWRYDVGGYAWDNSELSTDLWLWLYFLHTGRADVFKMARVMTAHTAEVDVYHSGKLKGFGTRHGVQHFSDSSKQLRISNVLYRRIYYYLTGDERMGDLISELGQCQNALLVLDSHRKVQEHAGIPDGFAMANIGLDCGPLAASWLTTWERRSEGWKQSRDLLLKMLEGLSKLSHGIGNNAILLNPMTGDILECPPPTPAWAISHLSMLFGFPEIFTELLDYAKDDYPAVVKAFTEVWLRYCRAYNGTPEVQLKEFGFEFPEPTVMWRQSHSTLTAIASVEQKSEELGKAAWDQFFKIDGYLENQDWQVNKASPPEFFNEGEEAPWVFTNETARYGVSAIFNLANIRQYL
ncbi:uncharacterized protein NECHADRAFT_45477 [Fusarium vanettenii 77-13-4]|uniref:Uncharacterized protein n=1 Tax=Fusarium vanettenii (strain ATCC MYA-4622 / CBS 123669 / FGSC 9596 / NRRL 45880 / 77-13-4) TaxID=660122 RepID=C7YXB1_FUSV7|nr:uncharacterized protein NECHADRAFT_45477 [Fusarium vanettenii 77-13-4]EEU43797.1 hypothetical protein NECHADRAFT_45477 [Fusarium vanettenii 77-13-4]